MRKLLRLKHKASGLKVIAAIGLLQSVLPLYEFLNDPSGSRYALENETHAWAVWRLPLLFLLLWLLCFGLVKATQNKKLDLEFFEKFTVWKGLAVLLIWPSILFWRQLLSDYHEALDFLHPFTSLVVMHLTLGFLSAIFFVPLALYLAHRQKVNKSDIKFLQNIRQNGAQTLFWVKPFFQEVGSDRLGKAVAYFVGASYLLFFYMTLCSLASPAGMAIKTIGSTIEAHDVNYIWVGRYGSHTGSYCVLDVRSNNETLQFALNACPACSRRPSANVVVTHHPIDYRNRRMSSVECE
jgi:hypothetical protein